MFRTWLCLKTALLAAVLSSSATAQTSVSPPATKPAPPASATQRHRTRPCRRKSKAGRGSVGGRQKKEWAKDATKWADCQRQWNKQKDEGRKNWPSLYKCMTN